MFTYLHHQDLDRESKTKASANSNTTKNGRINLRKWRTRPTRFSEYHGYKAASSKLSSALAVAAWTTSGYCKAPRMLSPDGITQGAQVVPGATLYAMVGTWTCPPVPNCQCICHGPSAAKIHSESTVLRCGETVPEPKREGKAKPVS